MKIENVNMKVKDIVAGYRDLGVDGVFGYGGLLDIRPPYQREFVYNDKRRKSVIETLVEGLPLNVMYWVKNENGSYEVLDGQQRTISICQYVTGQFDFNGKFFHMLTCEEQSQILNYELLVYICEGTEDEILKWFRTINVSGEKLTDQELRNASFTGPWLTNAKFLFSKPMSPANEKYGKMLSGNSLKQEVLEQVLLWISDSEGITIEEYMKQHRYDKDALALWKYFEKVMKWARTVFINYRGEMRGVQWGLLYNNYYEKGLEMDPTETEIEVKRLMRDEDVTNKKGVYNYILTEDQKYLHIRQFRNETRRSIYEQQDGVCPACNKTFSIEEMDADHIIPWSKGGKTTSDNCQMLCRKCNQRKSNK